jgi:hypothetical protein
MALSTILSIIEKFQNSAIIKTKKTKKNSCVGIYTNVPAMNIMEAGKWFTFFLIPSVIG